MDNYDAIFAFQPNLAEEKIGALLSRFEKRIKDHGGEYLKTEKMGNRRLAYTFRKHKGLKEAFYVMISFKGTGETVSSLRDAFRIQEEVVRHIITRAQEEVAAPAEEAAFPAEPLKEEKIGEPQ